MQRASAATERQAVGRWLVHAFCVDLPSRVYPRGAWVGLLAALILAAMPLLTTSTFSAPVAQTPHSIIYLPLVKLASPYRIAFVSDRDGNMEIYVMNADGSSQTNLTNHPGYDTHPVWSPGVN